MIKDIQILSDGIITLPYGNGKINIIESLDLINITLNTNFSDLDIYNVTDSEIINLMNKYNLISTNNKKYILENIDSINKIFNINLRDSQIYNMWDLDSLIMINCVLDTISNYNYNNQIIRY